MMYVRGTGVGVVMSLNGKERSGAFAAHQSSCILVPKKKTTRKRAGPMLARTFDQYTRAERKTQEGQTLP